ncbi:hypothetical protein P171DRAFT_167344 [Karstenula rhodostoma CBS 690.94]|uniref:Uncharacterized protein n=1 Tax=Karstenula rhodostoma CBS 690.94 TaxID=1392251 RepID=A0A9P4P745_9PLEO|nr:hypothetical protein P171DRAFT_167344 [Karstenula rhodostoma CBS 690.94]
MEVGFTGVVFCALLLQGAKGDEKQGGAILHRALRRWGRVHAGKHSSALSLPVAEMNTWRCYTCLTSILLCDVWVLLPRLAQAREVSHLMSGFVHQGLSGLALGSRNHAQFTQFTQSTQLAHRPSLILQSSLALFPIGPSSLKLRSSRKPGDWSQRRKVQAPARPDMSPLKEPLHTKQHRLRNFQSLVELKKKKFGGLEGLRLRLRLRLYAWRLAYKAPCGSPAFVPLLDGTACRQSSWSVWVGFVTLCFAVLWIRL